MCPPLYVDISWLYIYIYITQYRAYHGWLQYQVQPRGPGQLSRCTYSLRDGRSGIESRWVRGATHPSGQALGVSQPPVHSVTRIFPRVKQ